MNLSLLIVLQRVCFEGASGPFDARPPRCLAHGRLQVFAAAGCEPVSYNLSHTTFATSVNTRTCYEGGALTYHWWLSHAQ